MSDIPASPARLPPPRPSVRRPNKWPLVLATTVIVGAVGAMMWALMGPSGIGPAEKPQAQTDGGAGSAAFDILSRAPKTPEIPKTTVAKMEAAPPTAPDAPAPARRVIEPGMTTAEIEGRRQAWQAYYQQLAQLQQSRSEQMSAALKGDTEARDAQPQPSANAAPGGAQAGAAQGAGQGQGGFFGQPGATAATDYLITAVTNPISPYELKASDIIEGRMVSGLTSASHGIVRAVVTKPVFDHATGMNIVIPQGSTLVGVYQTGGSNGQELVEVGWERVIFPAPCDQSLDIGLMPGADQSGFSGFHDITETHFWQRAQALLLASIFSAGIQLSQPQSNSQYGGYSSQQIVAGALGQQLGEFGLESARRAMDIPPVQKIRNGYGFSIMVTKDIAFSRPWTEDNCGAPMSVSYAR